MNTPAKSRWVLAILFIAGFISGGACATGFLMKHLPPPGMPTGPQIIEHVLRDLRSEIHITAAQEQELMPILQKHSTALDAIRNDTLSKVLASITEKNAALEKVLTPEQFAKFQAIEKQRLQVFEKQEQQMKKPQ